MTLVPPRKIDVHAHLAGVGTQGSGCWTSPALRKRLGFRLLRRLQRVTEAQLATSFDQDWAARLADRGRASGLERLEECIEGGAVLIKWLPATQRIDPSDPANGPFYARLAETGIPLL